MPILHPLPAFTDNYIWTLRDERHAWVVDPGDAEPVLHWLAAEGLTLQGILLTHHHADHTGGVPALCDATQVPVYGPAGETLPQGVQRLREGDTVRVFDLTFSVMAVPGHTAGHIAYYAEPAGEAPLLFCGDTLFSAGCGRLFEGTPAQMLHSLDRLAALPPTTRVCCTHEYTLSNLRFAAAVEPGNTTRADHQSWCMAQREAGRPTLPSRIALERQINPFLRSREPSVRQAIQLQDAPAAQNDDAAWFAALRRWKDGFR